MKNTEVDLEEIITVAKEHFCDGIYFEWNDHPCGWDKLSFDGIENVEEAIDYEVDNCDISYGIYDFHDLCGIKLTEALRRMKKFWFEAGDVGNYNGYVWSGKN